MHAHVGIPKEIQPGEQRVALIPALVNELINFNCQITLENDVGLTANYPNANYQSCHFVSNAQTIYEQSNVILKIQPPTLSEIALYKPSSLLISFLYPYHNPAIIKALAERQISSFAMDLMPRITRAQTMDALSSQATVTGYKAVLLAANMTNRFFPMLTTAAGTIKPINVLIIGAGVAGLQAIATARRLGAVVSAFDVRSAAKEQIESLGAKMLQLNIEASAQGGYARTLTEEEKNNQQALLLQNLPKMDVVITTALLPGRPAPKILNQAMVEAMQPGAVIIDCAADFGGNCELTQPGKIIEHKRVTICGLMNIPSMLARDASNMYAKNLVNFFKLFFNDKKEFAINWQDDIIADTVITHAGEIKNQAVKDFLEGKKP